MAGGCLALWAAHHLPAAWSQVAVLAAAPVADLVLGHELKVSDEGDAVELRPAQRVRWAKGEARVADFNPKSSR